MSFTFLTCKRSAVKFKSKDAWMKGDPETYYFAEMKDWADRCVEGMFPQEESHSESIMSVKDESPVAVPVLVELSVGEDNVKTRGLATSGQKESIDECSSLVANKIVTIDEPTSDMQEEDLPIKAPKPAPKKARRVKTPSILDMTPEQRVRARKKRRKGSVAACKGETLPVRILDLRTVKKGSKWDLEGCQAEAAKHDNESQWSVKQATSFVIAQRNGWLHLCPTKAEVTEKVIDVDVCVSDAMRFESMTIWKVRSTELYRKAVEEGWLEVITQAFEDRLPVVRVDPITD